MEDDRAEAITLILHLTAVCGHTVELAGVSLGMLAIGVLVIEEIGEVYERRRGAIYFIHHFTKKKEGQAHEHSDLRGKQGKRPHFAWVFRANGNDQARGYSGDEDDGPAIGELYADQKRRSS